MEPTPPTAKNFQPPAQIANTVDDVPEMFFIEMAIGNIELHDLCLKHGVPLPLHDQWVEDPLYLHKLALAKDLVMQDGTALQARAGVAAMDALGALYQRILAGEMSDGDLISALRQLVNTSGLGPKTDDGPGVKVIFNIKLDDDDDPDSILGRASSVLGKNKGGVVLDTVQREDGTYAPSEGECKPDPTGFERGLPERGERGNLYGDDIVAEENAQEALDV